MATRFSRNDNGSERSTSTRAVATLLGVYTVLYLAIVGAIHFAAAPDAAAAVAPDATSTQVAATAPHTDPSADARDVSTNVPVDPEGPDNARECTEGIDTSCIYN